MKIFVCHSSDFGFQEKLYKPLRGSHLNSEHEIHLPQEHGKEKITKELIQSCDLIIAEISMPSTGQGIELGWADTFDIPIIAVYERGSDYSNSVRYLTDVIFEYTNADEMIDKITKYIHSK